MATRGRKPKKEKEKKLQINFGSDEGIVMRIAADSNQYAGRHGVSSFELHEKLEKEFGCWLLPIPLPYGDYCELTPDMRETIERRGRNYVRKIDFVNDIKVCVDRKNSVEEIANNICGSTKEHERFRNELIRAQKAGCKLYIVIENQEKKIKGSNVTNPYISHLSEMHTWRNPRLFLRDKFGKQRYPLAARGITVQKAMYTMQKKYGVKFLFCRPEESAKLILDILQGKYE